MPDVPGKIKVKISEHLNVQRVKSHLTDSARKATFAVAQQLLQDTHPFVPVLTGQLRDSGEARRDVGPAIDEYIKVSLVYTTKYAAKQHDGNYNHPSLGFKGPALYITRPLEMFLPFYRAVYFFELERHSKLRGVI